MVWGTLFGVGKGNLKIILHGWGVHAVPAFRVNSGVFYGCSLLSSALRWNRKQPLGFSLKNSKVFFSCISIWWRRSGAEVSWMCLLPPSVPHSNLMPLSSTAYKTELQKRVLVESKLAVPVEAIRDLGVSQQALRLFGVWAELLHCLTCVTEHLQQFCLMSYESLCTETGVCSVLWITILAPMLWSH